MARKAATLGFDYGQGYAFGRPRPLSELIEGLRGDESRRLRSLSLEI